MTTWEVVRMQPGIWQDFHTRFMQLAREEQGTITKGVTRRRMKVLRAYCDYKDHAEPVFLTEDMRPLYGRQLTAEELSNVEAKMHESARLRKKQGPLNAPETGRWTFGSGVSENFLE